MWGWMPSWVLSLSWLLLGPVMKGKLQSESPYICTNAEISLLCNPASSGWIAVGQMIPGNIKGCCVALPKSENVSISQLWMYPLALWSHLRIAHRRHSGLERAKAHYQVHRCTEVPWALDCVIIPVTTLAVMEVTHPRSILISVPHKLVYSYCILL